MIIVGFVVDSGGSGGGTVFVVTLLATVLLAMDLHTTGRSLMIKPRSTPPSTTSCRFDYL